MKGGKENNTIKMKPKVHENPNFKDIHLDNTFQKKSEGVQLGEIGENELLEKIGRINNLNKEINVRLEKMLSKIDEYE